MKSRLLHAIALSLCLFAARGEDWPQFRGPGGRAVSETANPPVGFSPTSNLLWKVAIPEGVSSPVVVGDRIFLTADAPKGIETLDPTGIFPAEEAGKAVETLAFDRKDGRLLWRRHLGRHGTPTPTPVSDGTFVFSHVGSIGVVAHDLDGREQWRRPAPKPDFSASASPILIGDKLIIVCDQEAGSHIEALDKQTGRLLWRVERPEFRRARATPFHWRHGGQEELVVSGSFALAAYDPSNGRQTWRAPGAARWAMSSLSASENLLFALAMKEGVGEDNQCGNGDAPNAPSALRAIRPGAGGDPIAWQSLRGLPYGNSPLLHQGRLFTVKSGGFVTSHNAETGQPIYQEERINAPDDYWSSPVAAAGRVYFASEKGVVTVMDAAANTPTILAQNKLNEQILATPALVGQTILIRTAKNLYSFGVPQ